MNLMSTRALGNTGLHISLLGFGAWATGGSGWEVSLGHQDDDESIAAIQRATRAGVNWVDTAPAYGLGHSEEVVGRALRTMADSRPMIFTKCSIRWRTDGSLYHDQGADSIRREVEESLRRLGVDTIDAYLIHWPIPADAIEEGWMTLSELRDEGKVRCIGVSNFDMGQLMAVNALSPVDFVQSRYSLLSREIESDLLPFCRSHSIGVVAYSPMAIGLLGGAMTRERISNLPVDDWRREHPEFRDPLLARNLAVVDTLRAIAVRYGCSPAEVAIAWVLSNPAISGAIVGLRSVQQVDGCVGAASIVLDADDLAELDSMTSMAEWVGE